MNLLMSTIRDFDSIENNHSLYHEENCMKIFCSSLGENASKVINFEKRKTLRLNFLSCSSMLHFSKMVLKKV